MSLSIRQFTVYFTLFIIILGTGFFYQIHSKIDATQASIQASEISAASEELTNAISITLNNVIKSAKKLSQWQEVKQQIQNPEIFAYWYSVRFKQLAHDLQQYTSDFMLYDSKGNALTRLDNNSLPYTINPANITGFRFKIISQDQIIYIIPVFSETDKGSVAGYLSTKLNLLLLLKSVGHLQYIELDSLSLKTLNKPANLSTLTPDNFSYKLHKSHEISSLENLISESITDIVLIIILPSLLLLVSILFLIGKPVRSVVTYINNLRINPEHTSIPYNRKFKIQELSSIYESISHYHTELTEKEKYLSLTLDSIGDAVITTDAELKIKRMNPVAEHLTGWLMSEAKDMPLANIFKLYDAETRLKTEFDFTRVIESGKAIQLITDSILISKNKKEFIISDSAAPILDQGGHPIGLVLVFNDITQQKIKDEQLQQSLKMDALGKLTGGIAHDFNNMLSIIIGYSDLLKLTMENNTQETDYIEQIHTAAERARKLTSKLLTFSKKSTSEKTQTDINNLLLAEQHMLEKTLTARIKLTLKLADDLWSTLLEQNIFQDAVLNMCINAMHAMPEGGTITIESNNTTISATDSFADLIPGDYVLVTISDTGTGMDKNTRQKIFDPFFSTKGDSGTGLGMSQVYGFVTSSGGGIHVYSEPGIGTRISIYLPRYIHEEDNSHDSYYSDDEASSALIGSEIILVVDDESSLSRLTCQMLHKYGYKTLQANSGEEALEILKDNHIDLLISDIIMPGMDGYQLSKIVSEKYPAIKIIHISGYSGDKRHDPDLNFTLINKPFTATDLLEKIRTEFDNK